MSFSQVLNGLYMNNVAVILRGQSQHSIKVKKGEQENRYSKGIRCLSPYGSGGNTPKGVHWLLSCSHQCSTNT